MFYTANYPSPLGPLTLYSDGNALTGLFFEGQSCPITEPCTNADSLPVFETTRQWLDIYFAGVAPTFTPKLHPNGTPFQMTVWNLLQNIPFGHIVTYGELAKEIIRTKGLSHMSAQAVGGAVGRNPIGIIVPCHRVVGVAGNLTGYAGGLDRKIKLLELEKNDMQNFFLPKK